MEAYVIYDRRNNGFVKNLQGRHGFAGCFQIENAMVFTSSELAQEALDSIQKKWHRQLSVKPLSEFTGANNVK